MIAARSISQVFVFAKVMMNDVTSIAVVAQF